MKRLGALLARSLVGALLLLALSANVASADPGRGNGHGPVARPQLLQPEDPGVGGGGYAGDSQPEDPGFSD